MRGVAIIRETGHYATCIDGIQYDTSYFGIKNIEYLIEMLYSIAKRSNEMENFRALYKHVRINFSHFNGWHLNMFVQAHENFPLRLIISRY